MKFSDGDAGLMSWLTVRLATVVSELAGGVVLFLPAAGRAYGGTFYIDYSRLWSSRADADTKALVHQFGVSSFRSMSTARASAHSVRLATVVSGLAGDV